LPEGADDKSFTATVTSDTVVTATVRDGALHLHGLRRGQSSVMLTTVNGVAATVTVRVVAEARFMVRVDDASKPLFFARADGFTIDYGDGVDSRDYTLQDDGVYTTREVVAGTVMILTVKGCDSLCFYRSGRARGASLLELIRISSDRSSMYQFAWGQAGLNKIHPGALGDLPNVTTYAYAFSNCVSLSALPDALFSGSPAVTSFAHVFYGCTSLQGVPADLFRRNHQVTTMTHAFRDCTALKSVPAGLFDSAVQVTTFSNLFYGCSSLSRLPEGLFRAAVSATDFSALCYGCQSLTALPAGLFTGAVNAMMFTTAFAYCNQLTALPDDLFRGLTKASGFYQSFLHCRSLTALPS
ncbi:phage tail protein I, partial [Escherichia coli]|nr:phage tail protein I [Escherichia coli]EJN4456123.1 phage tail protein I [Escherichia coli]